MPHPFAESTDAVLHGLFQPGRRHPLPFMVRAYWKAADPWRLPYSTPDLIQMTAKGLRIPRRWNADEFARQGRLLILAQARIAKLTQRKAAPFVAKKAVGIFRRQLNEVVRRVTLRTTKAVEIPIVQHEAMWLAAIADVFDDAGLDVQLELVPPIQSVMAQGYSKTSILLSQDADPQMHPRLARESKEIASKITRINATTRQAFERVIRQGIADGLTVTDLAKQLRERVMPMAHNRSLTIARTELNNAWTRGAAAAFQESKTLEYVSVIGCEAEEPQSPHYKGHSTCNYPDLPVSELEDFLAVGFHINHTGTIVPSGFRQDTNRGGL